MSYHIAIDIGASSGRVVLATIKNNYNLKVEEIHRFTNRFIKEDNFERWNIDSLFKEIIIGLKKPKR